MKIQFPNADSKKYFISWIVLVIIGWFWWFFKLEDIIEIRSYTFIILFGLGVGIISGLQPVKAFQACLIGLLAIELFLIPTGFSIYLLLFFPSLTSLFALIGAILRKIFSGQEVEIDLKRWQWIALIVALTLFSDSSAFIVIEQPSLNSFLLHLARFFIFYVIGLFCAGLFTGAFSPMEQKKLMKSVAIVSFGSHSIFVIWIFCIIIASREIHITDFAAFPLMGLLSMSVLTGTHIGCRWRKSKFIKIPHVSKDV